MSKCSLLSWNLYISRPHPIHHLITNTTSKGLVEMGAWLLLAFSLLLTKGFSVRQTPQSSCHAKLNENHHQHQANGSTIHLTLHHPRSPCSPALLPDLPFSEVLHHDESRAHMLSSRITKSHNPHATSSVSVPLSRGTTVGVGNYITKIGLGTPSVDYVMVVDTGSSLSWLQCYPCKISCHDQVGAIFDPTKSATYKAVQCSAAECGGLQSATLNPSACTSSNVCVYEASYGDSSFSVGYLGKDTLSLGSLAGKGSSRAPVLPGFIYGCGQDNEGLFGKAAGLIGLARNKLSLLSQLSPKLGSSFTYCLPTTASSGYLSIGPYDPSKLTYTPMVSSSLDTTLYFLRLTAITIAGKSLLVAPSAYTGTPTIIDSGTVITRLPADVYTALSKAITTAVKIKKTDAYSILDTCFKGSVKSLVVPEVALVFDGGAVMKLQTKNVFIDVDGGTTCLAFASSGSAAIIGNRQQQSFRVVYDVAKSKIGFAPGGCG